MSGTFYLDKSKYYHLGQTGGQMVDGDPVPSGPWAWERMSSNHD